MKKLLLTVAVVGLIAAQDGQTPRTTDTGLTITQLDAAPKHTSQDGDIIYVLYTGTLENGTVFDSSDKRRDGNGSPEPLAFKLGTGQVIKGFDEGMKGMAVGDRRRIVIPANMGYGDRRVGSIPPGSTLTFEVEMVRIVRPTK
jgi:peptidylprolyl isomerase